MGNLTLVCSPAGLGGTPTDPICFADQLANNEVGLQHDVRMS